MTQIVATLLGVMLWLSVATTGIAQETIRLASGEWSPYQFEHLKDNGVASRIVPQAFALEGIKVEYGYFPWSRSYEFAKTGEWDGTFLWFDTPERYSILVRWSSTLNMFFSALKVRNLIGTISTIQREKRWGPR